MVENFKKRILHTLSEFKNWKNSNPKISYSQSGEDLIVKFIFDRLGIQKPSYIDIGAHHPFNISNTAIFHELGSKGINVEPDVELIKEFKKHRASDVNLNIGISKQELELTYFVFKQKALNTFSEVEAQNAINEGNKLIEKRTVKTDSLNNVLKKYCNNVFPDFLSLDVEGFDEDILRTIDFNSNFPKVICVETISYSEIGKGIKNESIISLLENNNYMLYADTNINSIFVRKELWYNQA